MRTIIDSYPAGPVETSLPVRGESVFHPYLCAGLRRMHEAAVADVHAHVRVGLVARVVEHQVAGDQVASFHRLAELRLGARVARQGDTPGLLKHMRDQAAAVKS